MQPLGSLRVRAQLLAKHFLRPALGLDERVCFAIGGPSLGLDEGAWFAIGGPAVGLLVEPLAWAYAKVSLGFIW